MTAVPPVWRHAIPMPVEGVHLSRDAVAFVHFAVRYLAADEGRRNGLAELRAGSPLAREVLAACEVSLRRARHLGDASEVGQPARTFPDDPAPSVERRPDDLLTMTETAKELSVHERTARRLADNGELGRVTYAGRAKLVRRFEVTACKTRREGGR